MLKTVMENGRISSPQQTACDDPVKAAQPMPEAALASPTELGVREWADYDLVIDARSPKEFAEDHVPGAVNLPVVDDDQFAEVGTRHRTDQHSAYLIGVEYSLRNIADQIKPLISRYDNSNRFLVYCFRGGKRSRLWADNLRTIGFEVEVLAGGWKRYRQWVRDALTTIAPKLQYRVLTGPTGCGKTRLLGELKRQGQQVLDLEDVACHRGSLLGDIPDVPQPTQKKFDSRLLEILRRMDPHRPIWIEAESKKIGNLQLPEGLFDAMHRAPVVQVETPMAARVQLWREDYAHFAAEPLAMVDKLMPLKPLVGNKTLLLWRELAQDGQVDALFENVMARHYDPCYARSTGRNYGDGREARVVVLEGVCEEHLRATVGRLLVAD